MGESVRYQILMSVDVRVNVFDLTSMNKITRNTNLAVYHTSVVLGEKLELYFGFKANGVTGIDTADEIDQLPKSMKGKFYKTYHVGTTKRSFDYCKVVIARFKKDPQWLSDRYNIVYNNCHNFAWALCEALLGSGNLHRFPKYVFDCDKLSAPLYEGFIRHFINEKNPPYFLGKQPRQLGDDGIMEKKPRKTISSIWCEPKLCKEIMVY